MKTTLKPLTVIIVSVFGVAMGVKGVLKTNAIIANNVILLVIGILTGTIASIKLVETYRAIRG